MEITSQTHISMKIEGEFGEYLLQIPMNSPVAEALHVLQGYTHALHELEKKKQEKEGNPDEQCKSDQSEPGDSKDS